MGDLFTDTHTSRAVPHVVVAVATFQRVAQLGRLLPLLVDQVAALHDAQARIVVVDNDPLASAGPSVLAHGSGLVSYVHEPRPGIAAARNRAIVAAGDADVLVFIDDDEVPHPGWLAALVSSWSLWQCAAVTGPVTSIFDGPADEWVRGSRVFDRAIRETGSTNPGASSANLLLDLGVLRRHAITFDEEFGLSGGSDTMLAHALKGRGEQIRWCQEAGVSEYVPASRSQRVWVFRRTIRTSNTWGRVALSLAGNPAQRARVCAMLTARGLHRLVRGSWQRLVARTRRDVGADARGAVDVASGLGLLMGAFGVVRYEYRRPSSAIVVGGIDRER